jgi:hypothetical protein
LLRGGIDEAGTTFTFPSGRSAFKASFKQHFGKDQHLTSEFQCNALRLFATLAAALTASLIAVLKAKLISIVFSAVHWILISLMGAADVLLVVLRVFESTNLALLHF